MLLSPRGAQGMGIMSSVCTACWSTKTDLAWPGTLAVPLTAVLLQHRQPAAGRLFEGSGVRALWCYLHRQGFTSSFISSCM